MSKVVPIHPGLLTIPDGVGPLAELFRKSHAIFVIWQARRRRRAELQRLLRIGPHLLADVGLDYEDALAEMRKAPWQA